MAISASPKPMIYDNLYMNTALILVTCRSVSMINSYAEKRRSVNVVIMQANISHAGPALNQHWLDNWCLLECVCWNVVLLQYLKQHPRKHETFSQCWVSVVGPPSATMGQH